jgi:HIV Tat-specific factor 1
LFDWRPDKLRGERAKHEKTVIIKNLFTPELFDKEVHLILDYQNDLRDECSKCGTVKKVVIYDVSAFFHISLELEMIFLFKLIFSLKRHPEGVAQIMMQDPEEADLLIKMMNGRMFAGRKLSVETWDGKTKFK